MQDASFMELATKHFLASRLSYEKGDKINCVRNAIRSTEYYFKHLLCQYTVNVDLLSTNEHDLLKMYSYLSQYISTINITNIVELSNLSDSTDLEITKLSTPECHRCVAINMSIKKAIDNLAVA